MPELFVAEISVLPLQKLIGEGPPGLFEGLPVLSQVNQTNGT
jgi:hypothetical protein